MPLRMVSMHIVWCDMMFFLVTAAVSVECLAAVTCELEDIHPLGKMLGISEDTLSAIDSYYDDKDCKFRHTLMLWEMENHEEPVKLLISVLNELRRPDMCQTLSSLSSFGRSCVSIS